MQQANEKEVQNIKTFSKALGLVIKRHRKAIKKSVYSISAEVSIAKNSWGLVEKAEVLYPSIITVVKIAEALDMKPSKLLDEVYTELGTNFTISDIS